MEELTMNDKNTITEAAEQPISGVEDTKGNNTPSEDKKASTRDLSVYKHHFKKPFAYEGETYEEILFDFTGLTGRDMLAIESEMQAQNEYALSPEISRTFQCLMAAKAGRIASDVLQAMPIGDFTKITNAARDFLINTGY